MKVAVILLGPIEQIKNSLNKDIDYSYWKEINYKLVKDCDLYFHTDDNYKQIAEQFNPVKVITTESSYWQDTKNTYLKKYSDLIKETENSIPEGVHFNANFGRIAQWRRLNEVLNQVDLSEYDYIVKWRLDLMKFGTHQMNSSALYNFNSIYSMIVNNYGGLYEYIKQENFNREHLYTFKDFVYFASYSNFLKANLFPSIDKYIVEKEEKFTYKQEVFDSSDMKDRLKCVETQWLDSSKKPFIHLFTSETAWLLNCLQQNVIIKNIFTPFV